MSVILNGESSIPPAMLRLTAAQAIPCKPLAFFRAVRDNQVLQSVELCLE